MNLTFLEATTPLTKAYERLADGTINKTSYPHVYEVTSHVEQITSIAEFERCVKAHAAKNNCLLKGTPIRTLVKESRAGTTDTNAASEWVCFDIDGLAQTTPESFLAAVGLSDISYVVQYSASYLIDTKDLRCHIFMLLDKALAAPLLKQWLVDLNLSTPLLSSAMRLTKTGNSISWALDISACQNDKLLYIAPPTLRNIKDPLPKAGRVQLVKKERDRLAITHTIPSTAKNRERTNKRLDELREADGLPKRKTTYRMHGGMEVLVKPDVCAATEIKHERGFVYFNLNGGDSWAYYHPEDRPDYIYNFKGEAVYLTKELLPEYWEQLTQTASRVSSTGLTYLAFCDRTTSTYWRGTYDLATDTLDLTQARTETQLRHFGKQYGLPIGDFIPEWDMTFDPQASQAGAPRVDVQNHRVNLFGRTEYMKATQKKQSKCPPLIRRVVHHALGGDDEIFDYFINWVAYVLQNLDRTGTAWILSGCEGTGKGLLMNSIIRPMFGAKQTTVRRLEELAEKYNGFLRNSLFVFIDEIQTSSLQNEAAVLAKMRNFITEPVITVREMQAVGTEVRNFSNWICNANANDPVTIPKGDRRWNVGRYQTEKLQITPQEVSNIAKELQAFHDFLAQYKVDAGAARTPLNTADRDQLISISETSVDAVSAHLLDGDFGFFVDQLPTSDTYKLNALELNKVEAYTQVLRTLLQRTNLQTQNCNISRDELRVLYEYTVGSTPGTPHKFTSYLKHHRIHMKKVWVGQGTVNGIQTAWKDTAAWPQYSSRVTPTQTQAPVAPQKLRAVK